MNKVIIIFTGIIILSLGIYSSRLQYRINDLQNKIDILEAQIKNTDIEIRVLETEISHLTSISKVKTLSNKFLTNYHNINKNDFIKIVDIPINPLFE
ncbi:hypothetical protein HDR60_00215 [bacterium]|nr:hypothetical protein [bacterium]